MIKSIEMILSSEVGALANEIKKVWRDVKWGTPVSMSLYRMSHRVNTPAMTRIVSLIVKASEATGNISMAMNIAAEEAESESKLRQERLSNTIVYLLIIYMTFFCFLFIAVILSKSFLPMMPRGGGEVMGFGGGLDVTAIKRLMFHAASLNGFFSGLMIGQIVSGTPASGLKHSIIMLLMAYFTFTLVM
jgi:flagellar protein FlaJ